MSTLKIKLKHQVTWQVGKCTCMNLALFATFMKIQSTVPRLPFVSSILCTVGTYFSLLSGPSFCMSHVTQIMRRWQEVFTRISGAPARAMEQVWRWQGPTFALTRTLIPVFRFCVTRDDLTPITLRFCTMHISLFLCQVFWYNNIQAFLYRYSIILTVLLVFQWLFIRMERDGNSEN